MTEDEKLADFFANPPTVELRQYEALRAHFVDEVPLRTVAKRFDLSLATLQRLRMELFLFGKLPFFGTVDDEDDAADAALE